MRWTWPGHNIVIPMRLAGSWNHERRAARALVYLFFYSEERAVVVVRAAASPDQFAILARRYPPAPADQSGPWATGCHGPRQVDANLDFDYHLNSLVSSMRMATSRRPRPGTKEPSTVELAAFMTDRQFKRLVRSVGVSCFVKYLNDLTDLSLADGSLIQKMREAEGYTYGACHTRVFKAREIIRAGRAPDVVKLASRSSRVSSTTAAAARRLVGANEPSLRT